MSSSADMISFDEYITLMGDGYNVPGNEEPVIQDQLAMFGWQRQPVTDTDQFIPGFSYPIQQTNLGLAYYKNDDTGQIVITIDGWEGPTRDELLNSLDVASGVTPPYQFVATEFVKWVIENNQGYNPLILGHSQGGGIASLVALETGVPAFVGNAQGAAPVIESMSETRYFGAVDQKITALDRHDDGTFWVAKSLVIDGIPTTGWEPVSPTQVWSLGPSDHLSPDDQTSLVTEIRVTGDPAGDADDHIGTEWNLDLHDWPGVLLSKAHGVDFLGSLAAFGLDPLNPNASTFAILNEALNGALAKAIFNDGNFSRSSVQDGALDDRSPSLWFMHHLFLDHVSGGSVAASLLDYCSHVYDISCQDPSLPIDAAVGLGYQIANQLLLGLPATYPVLSLSGIAFDFASLSKFAGLSQTDSISGVADIKYWLSVHLVEAMTGLDDAQKNGVSLLLSESQLGDWTKDGHISVDFNDPSVFVSGSDLPMALFVADNQHASIDGTSGYDLIYGQDENDVIHGNGGADVIFGNGGNDEIFGGDVGSQLHGGSGDDNIHASNADVVTGDGGNDVIYYYGAGGIVDGGDGNDTLELDGSASLIGMDLTSIEIIDANHQTITATGTIEINQERANVSGQLIQNVDHIIVSGGVVWGSGLGETIETSGGVTVHAGQGSDTIILGPGNDNVWGDDSVQAAANHRVVYSFTATPVGSGLGVLKLRDGIAAHGIIASSSISSTHPGTISYTTNSNTPADLDRWIFAYIADGRANSVINVTIDVSVDGHSVYHSSGQVTLDSTGYISNVTSDSLPQASQYVDVAHSDHDTFVVGAGCGSDTINDFTVDDTLKISSPFSVSVIGADTHINFLSGDQVVLKNFIDPHDIFDHIVRTGDVANDPANVVAGGTFHGTAGDDYFRTNGSGSIIFAGAGSDHIVLGAGNDTVTGDDSVNQAPRYVIEHILTGSAVDGYGSICFRDGLDGGGNKTSIAVTSTTGPQTLTYTLNTATPADCNKYVHPYIADGWVGHDSHGNVTDTAELAIHYVVKVNGVVTFDWSGNVKVDSSGWADIQNDVADQPGHMDIDNHSTPDTYEAGIGCGHDVITDYTPEDKIIAHDNYTVAVSGTNTVITFSANDNITLTNFWDTAHLNIQHA